MPGSVDHCWTTPIVCVPMEILTTLAKAFIFTNKWLVAQGLYWNVGASHLSCFSSSQPYLQGLHKVSSSLAKSVCEFSDTVCLHPLTNKLHLWYWLLLKHISCDSSLQFVTDVIRRMGVLGKLIQYAMPILSSIDSPCITLPCVLSHCPSHYHPVAFQGISAQVFPIHSNGKLTDPHIQQKMWPISIHPCQYIYDVHIWCRTNVALLRTSINNPLFSSNCTFWLIDVHSTCSQENILEVVHLVPLDLQFRHMQRHVRCHVNIHHTHINQRHLYIMAACQNWVMMDAVARNRGTKMH